VYAVVFGSEELARGVGRRIQWIHEFVRGQGYSANEPGNLLWVHATLMETALGCYTDLVGPLSPADEETYYQEMKRVAEVFGLEAADQPATLADFRAWFDETVAAMHVTDAGRDLARFIMDPTLPLGLHVPTRPLLRLQRRFTVATLPPPIREQMGFAFDDRDAERHERARRAIRRTFRATPVAIRTAGNRAGGRLLLWQASRHVAAWEAKHGQIPQPGAVVGA
jgi:uncharacterized protein (DUF2236 family)